MGGRVPWGSDPAKLFVPGKCPAAMRRKGRAIIQLMTKSCEAVRKDESIWATCAICPLLLHARA